MASRNQIEGHPRNISPKLFENRPNTFGEEDFFSFHHILAIYGKIAPPPWQLCFSTNQHGFNESDRGSPKEHFYKIIWKSVNEFVRRWIVKFFSFRCHGNQNSEWIPKIWRNSCETIGRMLSVKFQPDWSTGYWGEDVDGRTTDNLGSK